MSSGPWYWFLRLFVTCLKFSGFANLQEEKENDILKQQLRVFMDDFQCEQNEKKKLILEKDKITEELQILKEKNCHLETQVCLLSYG